MQIKDWLSENIVYLYIAGSHCYGLNTSESDYDIRGCCVPPISYYLGLDRFDQSDSKETIEYIEPYIPPTLFLAFKTEGIEPVVWSLNKAIRLAADGNPNMIELLFIDKRFILNSSPAIESFFKIREAFISKLLKHRFSGYAIAQLKRIRNHKRWVDSPPAYPTREQFGIENIRFPKDQIHACDKLIEMETDSWMVDQTHLPEDIKIQLGPQVIRMVNKILEQLQIETKIDRYREIIERAAVRHLGFDEDFNRFLSNYKRFRSAKQDYESYQTWLKQRNPERAEIEKKFGFDLKHAVNLVRLLRMAREILEGKGVIVYRPDRAELMDIRYKGTWSFEELVSWAEREDKDLDDVMQKSTIPKTPNHKLINETLTDVLSDYFFVGS